MLVHLCQPVRSQATLRAVYNRREILNIEVFPEIKAVDVPFPQVPGSGRVVVIEDGKERLIIGVKFKDVTIADANRLRAEAAELKKQGRVAKAFGKIIAAVWVLEIFEAKSRELPEAREEMAEIHLAYRKPRDKRMHIWAAAREYETALKLWESLGDEAAVTRCKSQAERLHKLIAP